MRKLISIILACLLVISMAAGCTESDTAKPEAIALVIGEHQLTTTELKYFYMDKISEYQQAIYEQYYSYFGSYWSAMMGFDTSKPLNEQKYDTEKTWADYFMDSAIKTARDAYTLYDAAMATNHQLSEAEQSSVSELIATITSYATYYGYGSVSEYLQEWYGAGASEAGYKRYFEVCTIAYSYMNSYSASLEFEQEDYREYDAEHFDDFSVVTFHYYSLQHKNYLGEGMKDEAGNTTWTDEQIEEAYAALEADKLAVMAGKVSTKDAFDSALQALEINKVEEGKTKVTATEVPKAYFDELSLTPDAKQWLKDPARKNGDFEVFGMYTYAEHEDADHEHGDDCGCERTLDAYAFLLFSERDDQLDHLIDIRHILVKFTGGTTDSSTGVTTYSDAEKAKAKEEAEKLYQQWKDGAATEESFAELANAESDDQGGKVTNGGIYEDVYPGRMVEAFDAWCFDPARKAGDTGIVETEYGYHIMYFSATCEMTYRDQLIDYTLRNNATEAWYNEMMEAASYTVMDLSEMPYDLVLDA